MADKWDSDEKIQSDRVSNMQSANTHHGNQLGGNSKRSEHQAWNKGTHIPTIVPVFVLVGIVGFFLFQNWNGMPLKDAIFVFGIFGLIFLGMIALFRRSW